MKWFVAFLMLASSQAFAEVEFSTEMRNAYVEGRQSSLQIVVSTFGIKTDENGLVRVVLNTKDKGQLILSGAHANIGLALIPFQDKCIKVLPGARFQSVSFITACESLAL